MLNLLVYLVTARLYKDNEPNFCILLWAIKTENCAPMLHINFVPSANLNPKLWVAIRQQCSEVPLLCTTIDLLLIHGCRYTKFVHLNSSTIGVFLTIISILFLILIFIFNLNVLSSLCKVDIRSTAINIFSALPVRRPGCKGKESKPYFLRVWDAQWKTQKDRERKIVCREMSGREAPKFLVL